MTFFVEGVSKHHEPELQVRRIGAFESLPEAIDAARRAIDAFLGMAYERGMEADTLFSLYQSQGEHAIIFRDNDKTINVPGFNHLHYALNRAVQLCGGKQ